MKKWKIDIYASDNVLGKFNIKREIFQSYPLFPSLVLKKTKTRNQFRNTEGEINQLLNIDDLKSFSKILKRDTCMEFGINTCAILVMRNESGSQQ